MSVLEWGVALGIAWVVAAVLTFIGLRLIVWIDQRRGRGR